MDNEDENILSESDDEEAMTAGEVLQKLEEVCFNGFFKIVLKSCFDKFLNIGLDKWIFKSRTPNKQKWYSWLYDGTNQWDGK